MTLVTDVRRYSKKYGKEINGFYMNGYLKSNLDGIPAFLKKSWDVVGIVSGHGKTRIGKSTIASQCAFYIAWLLAGGKIITDKPGSSKVIKVVHPKKEVRFSLKENVVFSANDLQKRAVELYDKYGKSQVILYDEGKQGLDSSRAMESINKGMEDFFQECGFMGHVIIIVLPSFFKLHEDYAVARSLFLIDVFADKNFNRGYFNFYNERQKEFLYFFGKKRVGTSAKYSAGSESFWGRFTSWLPFDKVEYEQMKKEAIQKKRMSRTDRRIVLQRNALIWFVKKNMNMTYDKMVTWFKDVAGLEVSKDNLILIVTEMEKDRKFKAL